MSRKIGLNSETGLVSRHELTEHRVFLFDATLLGLKFSNCSLLALSRLVGGSSIAQDAFISSLFLFLCGLGPLAWWQDGFDLWYWLTPGLALLLDWLIASTGLAACRIISAGTSTISAWPRLRSSH